MMARNSVMHWSLIDQRKNKSGVINQKLLAQAFLVLVEQELEEIQKQFERITNEFSARSRPVWSKRITQRNLKIMSGQVYTKRGGTNQRVIGWLTHGTKERRAVMNPGATIRTRHRSFAVGGTPGGMQVNHFLPKGVALPGIKAREFDELVRDTEQPKFEKRAVETMTMLRKIIQDNI